MTKIFHPSLAGHVSQVAPALHPPGADGMRLNENERREFLLLKDAAGRAARRLPGGHPAIANQDARMRRMLQAASGSATASAAKPAIAARPAQAEASQAVPAYIGFPATGVETLRTQGAPFGIAHPSGKMLSQWPVATQVAGYDAANRIFRMIPRAAAPGLEREAAAPKESRPSAGSSARLNFLRSLDR